MADTTILVTSDHGRHPSGFIVHWRINSPPLCICCVVELLSSENVLLIKKKFIVSEFLGALSARPKEIITSLCTELRLGEKLCECLLGFLQVSDNTFVPIVTEAVVQLTCLMQSDQFVCFVLDHITHEHLRLCNYKKSLVAFNIVGRLLEKIAPLARQLVLHWGSFLDYMVSGLKYPDETVQSSLFFILIKLYKEEDQESVIPANISEQIAQDVMCVIARSNTDCLLINALALLRQMLNSESVCKLYMKSSSSLVSALQKILISNKDILQVAAVQCVITLTTRDTTQQFSQLLLEADIAEYLFEALATTNELLISSIFCCMLLLSEVEAFFKKNHLIYGFEPILTALDYTFKMRNPQIISHGMRLLATILEKHPVNVRLLTSAALVTKCLSVITEAVKHHNHSIMESGALALTYLMRREVLPSPVPYDALIDPLQLLMSKSVELEKLFCKRGVQASSMVGKDISGKSKMAEAQSKLTRAESRIEGLVRSLEAAFILAVQCKSDPSANMESFLAPGTSVAESRLDNFVHCLLQALDECCVPLVLTHYQQISNNQVYTSLFASLVSVGQLCPQELVIRFNNKLASTGVIRIALHIKARTDSTAVKQVIDKFLLELCQFGSSYQDEDLKRELQLGLAFLQGSLVDILSVLNQHADGTGVEADQVHAAQQHVLLYLLYLSYEHGDRCVSPSVLFDTLCAYLCLHPDVHLLPNTALQSLVFLMAVCTGSTQAHMKKEQQKGLQLLSMGLSKCSSTSSWLLGHPQVFQWCFLNPKISNMQGKHVLKQWLSIIPAQMSLSPLDISQEPGWAELFTLVKENTKCLKAALDILTDGDEESVSKVTLLLGRVFEKDGKQSPNPKTVSKLKQMLSDVVHRIFLAKSVKKAEHNLTAMLEILLIMQDQFVTGINATDLKLVNQVCSLLGNDNEKIPKQLVFMFEEFLSNLLLQAGKSQDNRVATIILTDKSFLCILQHLVLSNEDIVSAKALQLVALLVLQQADFSIPHLVKSQIQLQLVWLLERTKSKVYLQQISVLQFWAVYFSSQFTSSCAIVELLDDTDHTDLVGPDDTQLNIKTQYLRKLLIYIQQAVFKENRHLQCVAVICLHNLLTRYLKPQVLKTGRSLVEQPWNRFMLTTLLETYEPRKTPTCVLAIVNLLVSHVGGELIKAKQLENIVTAFLNGDLKQDSWWNDVVVFLHYVCHNHILDSNLEKKVINKLEKNHQYTDQCSQSDDTKKISKMYAMFDRSKNA